MTVTILMKEYWETKHPKWRNDQLIKDANNALNLLMRKGYLTRNKFGFRGWVREIDGVTCKLVLSTDYDGKVLCALLNLYFPNRRMEAV